MLRPMLPLAFSVAILDEHIRLARHEIGTSLLAALGATVSRSIATIVHTLLLPSRRLEANPLLWPSRYVRGLKTRLPTMMEVKMKRKEK